MLCCYSHHTYITQVWYPARVIGVSEPGEIYIIEYLDDGNIEEGVEVDELRVCEEVSRDNQPDDSSQHSLPVDVLSGISVGDLVDRMIEDVSMK